MQQMKYTSNSETLFEKKMMIMALKIDRLNILLFSCMSSMCMVDNAMELNDENDSESSLVTRHSALRHASQIHCL